MYLSEISNQIVSLNNQISNLQNMKNCFFNEETQEIIPINEAAGQDLTGFKYYDFLPENILNNIVKYRYDFSILENHSNNLKKEIENFTIKKYCEENPEWSEDEYKYCNLREFFLEQPTLKFLKEEKGICFFSLIDELNDICEKNGVVIIKFDYSLSQHYSFIREMCKNNSGQIIKPAKISFKMIQEEKLIHGKIIYKFKYLESKKFWMNSPGRKSK